MTKIVQTAAFALLLAVVPVAKTNAQTYRTNVLIGLSVSLTGYEQAYQATSTDPYNPTVKTSKTDTSRLIGMIAKQAHITNNLSDAKLYWRQSWIGSPATNLSSDTILRTGTEDTVVTNYFALNFSSSFGSTFLVMPTARGTTNVTEYAPCNAILSTSQGSFSLNGISTKKSASLVYNSKVVENIPIALSFTTSLAGSGSVGFHQAEWKGTLNGSGQKVELEQLSQ